MKLKRKPILQMARIIFRDPGCTSEEKIPFWALRCNITASSGLRLSRKLRTIWTWRSTHEILPLSLICCTHCMCISTPCPPDRRQVSEIQDWGLASLKIYTKRLTPKKITRYYYCEGAI